MVFERTERGRSVDSSCISEADSVSSVSFAPEIEKVHLTGGGGVGGGGGQMACRLPRPKPRLGGLPDRTASTESAIQDLELIAGLEALRSRLLKEVDRLDVWLTDPTWQRLPQGPFASAAVREPPISPPEPNERGSWEDQVHTGAPFEPSGSRSPPRPDKNSVSAFEALSAACSFFTVTQQNSYHDPSLEAIAEHKIALPEQAVQQAASTVQRTPTSPTSIEEGWVSRFKQTRPMTLQSLVSGQSDNTSSMASPSGILYHEDKEAHKNAKLRSDLERESRRLSEEEIIRDNSRRQLRKVVSSTRFEGIVAVAVLMNAVLIGVDVEIASYHPGEDNPIAFYIVQHCFTGFFLVELLMRMKAYGVHTLFIKQGLGWPWFDLFIVVSAVTEGIVDLIYLTGASKSDGVSGFSQLRMGRVVKVTRLVRTFRIQRIIRIVAPLRTLVYSVAVTLNSLLWAMILLLLIMYVVGVAIVQTVTDYRGENLTSDTSEIEQYWSSLVPTMTTLFQSISGGVSWRDPALSLDEASQPTYWAFMFFICFVYFAVLNVVTGVFCSSAIETTQRNPEVIASSMLNTKHTYEKNLRQLFTSIGNNSEVLTLGELEDILRDEMKHAQLTALEIDVNDAWTLFRLIDADRSGIIDLEEFIDGCRALKGNAKGIDMASLRTDMNTMSRQLVRFMRSCEDQFEILTGQPFKFSTKQHRRSPPSTVIDEDVQQRRAL